MQYQFTRPVTVQGVPHVEGETIDEAALPTGSLECLLSVGQVRPVVSPVAESASETKENKQPGNVATANKKPVSGNSRKDK